MESQCAWAKGFRELATPKLRVFDLASLSWTLPAARLPHPYVP